MATIYCLNTLGMIWYVGSTLNKDDRERRHRNRSAKNYGGALIPLEYEWSFKILESCSTDERKSRERYWIELLKPLYNKCLPGRTAKEYASDWKRANKEKLAEIVRDNRSKNPEAMREYERKYREENRDKVRAYQREYARVMRAKKKAAETIPDQ